jgi:hypothetical protein
MIFFCTMPLFSAEFYDSGTEFSRHCSGLDLSGKQLTNQQEADQKACNAYVQGLSDGVTVQHIWSKSHGDKVPADFCLLGHNISPAGKLGIVLRYLRDHPDRAQLRAVIPVSEALHESFPCQK